MTQRYPWMSILLVVAVLGAGCGKDKSTNPPAEQIGTIMVEPSPLGIAAPWHLDGPEDLEVDGTGVTILADQVAGDYTLTWGDVAGWNPPDPAVVQESLASGDTLLFAGTYTQRLGTIEIQPEPDGIAAPWTLQGPESYVRTGAGYNRFGALPVGDYTVFWEPLEGWDLPDPAEETVAVTDGVIVTVVGTYTERVDLTDPYEPNDALVEAFFLGGPLRDPEQHGVVVLTTLGAVLGLAGDVDMFAFTAFAGIPIAIRVEPLATGASPIDAQDLGLRLWRRVSAETNQFALLAQINFNGAGAGEYHPPIQYTLAGYMVAEVYTTGPQVLEQAYRLRISNAAIEPR